jgi:hypothetical protein
MRSPEVEYEYLKAHVNNISDIAFYNLYTKYIINDLSGKDKVIQIDDTDQESVIIKRNGGYPLPGFIYTFIYKGKEISQIINEKPQIYIDFVPLVFCMNIGKGIVKGINLNLLPANVRLNFLQGFFILFKPFFENVEKLTQNNQLALNEKFISFVRSGDGQDIIRILNSRKHATYEKAYRSYNFEDIENFRMVEYNEWKYIPFYEPKDAFRKMNYKQIQKLYYKK